MSPTGAKKKAAAKKAPSNARVVRRESNGNGNGADDGQRLVELTGLVERSAIARPLRGSLPMQLRVTDDDNGGSVEVLPAILYAPPHLVSNTGSTAPPSEGAMGSTSYAVTGTSADAKEKDKKHKKHKKDKTPKNEDDDAHEDEEEDEPEESEQPDVSTPFPVVDAGSFLELAEGMLDPEADGAGASATGTAAAKSASYDFDEYFMLRNQDDPYAKEVYWNTAGQIIPADPRFQRFCTEAQLGIIEFCEHSALALPYTSQLQALITGTAQSMYGWWYGICAVRAFNRLNGYSREPVAVTNNQTISIERFYADCLAKYLMWRYDQYTLAYYTGGSVYTALGPLLTVAAWEAVVDDIFDEYFGFINQPDPTAPDKNYAFEPYPTNEILFGIRVVHRQDWRRLGYARGELVKSIPLGPREVQRVSVKINTRRKTARTSEQSTSFETSSESTNTSRNTTEVVDEASEKLNQHAEASVGGGYAGFFEAKVGAGIALDQGSSSKNTKTRLNELMEKTASRMKRDTKVTISTESETTFEDTRASEITNPNDELGITYLYYRLQLRYWVTTEIAEVQSVVFVPQRLPEWNEVTERWVKDHADSILRVLLDPAFAPVLTAIRQEPITLGYLQTNTFQSAANAGISAAQNVTSFTGGGDMPDLLASGQEYYSRDYERRANLKIEQDRRDWQTKAFLLHIQRNILHYMRAIWADEEYDQRMQRYSRLRVPVSWTFVPLNPPAPGTTPTALEVEGVFMPDSLVSPRPLNEVIDPIGPIGYYLNCAIYRLRDDPGLVNLHQALSYLRAAYTRFTVTTQVLSGPATVRDAVAHSPRSFSADYTIQLGTNQKWLLVIPNQPQSNWPQATVLPDGSIDVLGIRLWIDGTPAAGNQITIKLRVTADMEDPYLRMLRTRFPLPPAADEPALFTDAVLSEMAYTFAELEAIAGESWADLTTAQQEAVKARYHLFLMYRESGRLVTIDTPNLVLDLEGSRSPALEPFKRLHRYVDVLKEFEEMRRRSFDNRRRNDLIDDGELGDPEIERVTLVGAPAMLNNLIPVPQSDDDHGDDD